MKKGGKLYMFGRKKSTDKSCAKNSSTEAGKESTSSKQQTKSCSGRKNGSSAKSCK